MATKPSLFEVFSDITDSRRGAGRRHSIATVLVIATMGTMSGYQGYKPLGEFVRLHRDGLVKGLGLHRERLPSYSTIRRVMMSVDSTELCGAFHRWSKGKVKIRKGEWLSVDGKGMKGTVSDRDSEHQDFAAMVTLYCGRKGLALHARPYRNKQESETETVRALLGALDLEGAVFTLDALHCQKNG